MYQFPNVHRHKKILSAKISRRQLIIASGSMGMVAASGQFVSKAEAKLSLIHGWRYCVNCSILFNEDSKRSVCPSKKEEDGRHVAAGHDFVIVTGHEDTCFGDTTHNQSHWRQCIHCAALYFAKGARPEICPANGDRHYADDKYCYSPPINRVGSAPRNKEGAKAQGGWRYCGKCTGMFFDGDLNNKGVCPAKGDGSHAALGDFFVLAFL